MVSRRKQPYMIAGITGHQIINNYDVSWIKDRLIENIKAYKIDYGYSSLAVGIDQMAVNIFLQLNVPYCVVIPCKQYETTFESVDDKTEYYSYLKSAADEIELDYNEPSELAFYSAGRKIVELSDFMFAVWDGKVAKGLGGTGDIVKYAQKLFKTILHINPLFKSVKLINS